MSQDVLRRLRVPVRDQATARAAEHGVSTHIVQNKHESQQIISTLLSSLFCVCVCVYLSLFLAWIITKDPIFISQVRERRHANPMHFHTFFRLHRAIVADETHHDADVVSNPFRIEPSRGGHR
jgi:hypothetical protein